MSTTDNQSMTPLVVLTVAERAAFLRVSESLVRRLIRERRIPFFQIDGRYLFYRPVVQEWMRSITVIPGGQPSVEVAAQVADQLWEKKEVK